MVNCHHVNNVLQQRLPYPLSSKCGTHKTVKARFWPWLSGQSPQNSLSCSLFALKRTYTRRNTVDAGITRRSTTLSSKVTQSTSGPYLVQIWSRTAVRRWANPGKAAASKSTAVFSLVWDSEFGNQNVHVRTAEMAQNLNIRAAERAQNVDILMPQIRQLFLHYY